MSSSLHEKVVMLDENEMLRMAAKLIHAVSTLKDTEKVTEKIVNVFLNVTQSEYDVFAGVADTEEAV